MVTPVKQGTENVVSCLGREVPIPPNPPPIPPNVGSGAKKLSVYDGVVWIVGGAPPYSAMKLGEAGRDIASTGNIYFSGNSADSGGAYFSGLTSAAAQRLTINAGMGGFPALELHATASPALSVQQDNTSGRAVLYLGDVYVSGAVKVLSDPTYPSTKSSVVQTPNGERKLYATEAPDARFADYGTGKLENGVAHIQLDPTFAETLAAEQYHVNLTAQDIPTTLSVIKQDASGFDVVGAEDVSFYYEVVGIRKGFAQREEQ
ncbi:MAG: hypothetical protein Q7T25_11330 [Sideroxyarcus sp.]|nr:hypothetical protein [Sideroxyarcus sp.]